MLSVPNTGPLRRKLPQYERGVNFFQTSFSFTQYLDKFELSWLLLDTCSTHSVSNDKYLVKDIVYCKKRDILTVCTNEGENNFTKKATLKLLPIPVKFKEDSLSKNYL